MRQCTLERLMRSIVRILSDYCRRTVRLARKAPWLGQQQSALVLGCACVLPITGAHVLDLHQSHLPNFCLPVCLRFTAPPRGKTLAAGRGAPLLQ